MPPERLAQGAVLRCDRTVSIERTLYKPDGFPKAKLFPPYPAGDRISLKEEHA